MIHQLAIIGAGPAGIATAVEAYTLGMRDIVLFEKDENHNSTIRKFYKDNKRVDVDWKGQKVELDGTIYFVDGTKESTLDFFDSLLDNDIVELKTHTDVQSINKIENNHPYFEIITNNELLKAKYVVVTIGRMGKPNKPSYKIPGSIRSQVNFTLDKCGLNEKVMIVGGGDSAIEYAVDLANKNEVSICYRRGTFRRANPTNQEDIKKAVENGSLRALLNTEIESIEGVSGKIKVNFTKDSKIQSETFDRLIYAIGGTTPSGFLQSADIKEENGKPMYDENYETNIKGLFVAGDITQESGGSIALGLNHGFAIAQYIMSKENNV